MGGEEKGGMDWVEEEKSRMNRVKRRRLEWIGLRSWVIPPIRHIPKF